MTALRNLTGNRARLMLALLALALTVRALVPAGFMLAPAAGARFLTVTICSDASGAAMQMRLALPDKRDGDGDPAGAAKDDMACAFAALGQGALGGADPALLAAALGLVLLIGLAPLAHPDLQVRAFLRPPLRGPPART